MAPPGAPIPAGAVRQIDQQGLRGKVRRVVRRTFVERRILGSTYAALCVISDAHVFSMVPAPDGSGHQVGPDIPEPSQSAPFANFFASLNVSKSYSPTEYMFPRCLMLY